MSITPDELERSTTICGYPAPGPEIHEHLVTEIHGHDFTRQELAMFLAQLIHQSEGFQRLVDPNAVAEDYLDNGKSYLGRGYMLVSWASNYEAASRDLGMGDRLLDEPELVAQDPGLAMRVSVWYWVNVVRPETTGEENCFGATTRAINGAIECSGGFHPVAHERWLKYLKIAQVLDVEDKALECGCYN